jgi:hypothetical protein
MKSVHGGLIAKILYKDKRPDRTKWGLEATLGFSLCSSHEETGGLAVAL